MDKYSLAMTKWLKLITVYFFRFSLSVCSSFGTSIVSDLEKKLKILSASSLIIIIQYHTVMKLNLQIRWDSLGTPLQNANFDDRELSMTLR